MLAAELERIDVAVQTSLGSLDDQSRSVVEEELSKLREDKSLLEGKIRGYLTLNQGVAVQTFLGSLDDQSRSVVEEELSQLCKVEDKLLLEGKIRGYLTLSDICQEYKEELSRLKTEYQKLLDKVKLAEMESEPQHLSNASPTPVNDLGTNDGRETEQRNKLNVNTENPTKASTSDNLPGQDTKIHTTDLFNPGPDEPKSSERSKSIPEVTSDQSMESTHNKQPLPASFDKYPMQESMAMSSHSHLNQESLTGLGFEHVSDQIALGESAGTYRNNQDLMYFASVTQQEDKTKTKQEVTELNEVITSLPLQSEETSKVVQTVTKVLEQKDKQIKKLTHMNHILIEKNTELQREKKEVDKDRQKVLEKVQRLEKEVYKLNSRSNTPHEGWVRVDKESVTKTGNSSFEKIPDPSSSITELGEQNKMLKDANQKWSQEWDKLREHYESRISDLQTERDRIAKEITETKIKEEAKERDFEKMIMDAKKRAGEEESAKEDALHQLNTANSRLDSINNQVVVMQDELIRVRREKQSVETELAVIRQQGPVEAGRAVEMPLQSSPDKTLTELKNDNCVLRHQILLFQEDFDRERQDRATAQSIKDDLKKQNDTLKKRVRHLETKVSNAERQTKTTDETNRKLLQDKEKLQQELCDVKNQLQRERENHAMSQYTQQQHQQQHHQQQAPVVQSAGFYQRHQPPAPPPHPPPQPERMFGQIVSPPQPHPTVIPPNTCYQHRPQDFVRPASFMPASQPQVQHRNTVYTTNQPGQETEMLVGSWACTQCTYVNYPGRTVCEMCGYIRSPTTTQPQYRPLNGPLTPRGDEQVPGYHGYNVAGTRQTPGQTAT